ncbi:MAG: ATP-dependent Clp protease ATP-binding subunit ClpC, partial [Solirubrobacteraceae bacterium]|nr:ATP-dependent Clp protease ATP-binding subunit ClpC [Solirubrobacteraceae bacterium]
MDPHSDAGAGLPPCLSCGRRPGTVEVVYPADGENVTGAICDRCAHELVSRPTAGTDLPTPTPEPAEPARRSATPALDEFGRDLTAEAAAGRIDPVIGRESEIEQTVEILARRRKNNAGHIGEAGVGKTALAAGLALRNAREDVP